MMAPERTPLHDLLGLSISEMSGRGLVPTEHLTDDLLAATGLGDVSAMAALQDVLGSDFVNGAFAKSNANDRELESRIAALTTSTSTADTNLSQRITAITLASLGGVPLSSANLANGYARLTASALLPTSIFPPVGLISVSPVVSQAAMLALVAEPGDVAVRTDQGRSYMLRTSPATTLANWQELLSPTDAVTSVFGRAGVVGAQVGDYAANLITNTPAGNIAAATVQAALNELDAEKVATTDGRLSDARTPVDGSVTAPKMSATNKGIIICTSATRPVSPVDGQHIYETDTKARFYNTGTPAAPAWSPAGGSGGASTQIATVRRVANLVATNNAWTAIPWDTEVTDVPGWFAPANPNWLTFGEAGKYQAIISGTYASNATGIRSVRILRKSGVNTVIEGEAPLVAASVDSFGRCMRPVIFEALAGDSIGGEAYQNSGVGINFGNGGNVDLPIPTLTVVRLP